MQILKEKIVRYETDGSIVKGYDAGELIRCKDCKFWVKNPYGGTAGLCNKHMLGTLIASFETDWCCWAERKEE